MARRFSLLPEEDEGVAAKVAAANRRAEGADHDNAVASLEAAIQDSWEKLSPTDRQRIADRYLSD